MDSKRNVSTKDMCHDSSHKRDLGCTTFDSIHTKSHYQEIQI